MIPGPPSGGRVWVDVPLNTAAPDGAPDYEQGTMNSLEDDLRAAFDFKPGERVVIVKDRDTGFWPTGYLPDRTPVYSGGAVDSGKRITDRADVRCEWEGPDPSPGIVTSGDLGMLAGSDKRTPTP